MSTTTERGMILIIGASSGIGLQCCKQALEQGFAVRAFSRSARKIAIEEPRLEKVTGDALERADVEAALEGCDAVIQSLGVPLNPETVLKGTTLFSEATAVLLPAMQAGGVKRLVTVTGFGAGDSAKAIPAWQKPAFKLVFERIYRDKGIQERQIRESDRDWTIARPTVLTNGRRSHRYEVIADPAMFRSGRISRADVAEFIVGAIRDGSHIGDAPVLTR